MVPIREVTVRQKTILYYGHYRNTKALYLVSAHTEIYTYVFQSPIAEVGTAMFGVRITLSVECLDFGLKNPSLACFFFNL